MSACKRARRAAAGFTLVELMVALTGGLFISLAVFALARDSGRFYQREARVANATLGGLLGFERLRTDIARAGFMSSPNINRDIRQCGPTNPTWPKNLRNLASLQVSAATVAYPILSTTNGRVPQELLLSGAYTSSDMFAVTVIPQGVNTMFRLQDSQPALLRLGGGTNPTKAMMDDAFPSGQGLRIVAFGRTYYGQILSTTGAPGDVTVWINSTPPIQFSDGNPCGLKPGGSNILPMINVVNFIHYDLRNLSTDPQTLPGQTTYASLYTNSGTAPGEATRTELVRVMQDVNGNAVPGTEEIVAEYAVDFNVQLNAVTTLPGVEPVVTTITSTNALFSSFTGPTFGTLNTPELIRSVRVRLGVRSREGDRDNTVPDTTGNGLFRFNLGVGGGGAVDGYARVRTFQADVALHNQADVLW